MKKLTSNDSPHESCKKEKVFTLRIIISGILWIGQFEQFSRTKRCFLTSKLPLIVSLNVTDTVSDELPFSATVLMLNLMGECSSRSSTKA